MNERSLMFKVTAAALLVAGAATAGVQNKEGGHYLLIVKKEWYEDFKSEVNLGVGKTIAVAANLMKLPPPPSATAPAPAVEKNRTHSGNAR